MISSDRGLSPVVSRSILQGVGAPEREVGRVEHVDLGAGVAETPRHLPRFATEFQPTLDLIGPVVGNRQTREEPRVQGRISFLRPDRLGQEVYDRLLQDADRSPNPAQAERGTTQRLSRGPGMRTPKRARHSRCPQERLLRGLPIAGTMVRLALREQMTAP